MINFDLIKRLSEGEFTSEDVQYDPTEIGYDIKDPFKKYYHLETVDKVIDKVLKKEITPEEFSKWAKLYDYILNGGFKDEFFDEIKFRNLAEEIAMDDVSYLLDGLSSYAEDMKKFNLMDYKKIFAHDDKILKNSSDYEGYYYVNEDEYAKTYYVHVIIRNRKDGTGDQFTVNYLSPYELKEEYKEVDLKTYQELLDALKD